MFLDLEVSVQSGFYAFLYPLGCDRLRIDCTRTRFSCGGVGRAVNEAPAAHPSALKSILEVLGHLSLKDVRKSRWEPVTNLLGNPRNGH